MPSMKHHFFFWPCLDLSKGPGSGDARFQRIQSQATSSTQQNFEVHMMHHTPADSGEALPFRKLTARP